MTSSLLKKFAASLVPLSSDWFAIALRFIAGFAFVQHS
jgi:hypothetical protein